MENNTLDKFKQILLEKVSQDFQKHLETHSEEIQQLYNTFFNDKDINEVDKELFSKY